MTLPNTQKCFSNSIAFLLLALVCVAVGIAYFNFIQNHFINGGYLHDTGLFLHLFSELPRSLYFPRSISLHDSYYFSTHISPIFILISKSSHLIPLDKVDYVSLVFALQASLVAFSAIYAVYSLPINKSYFIQTILAAVCAVALFLSAPNTHALAYPHHEWMFAPLATIFFVGYARSDRATTIFSFLALLSVREDMGFHLFGLIAVLLTFELFLGSRLSPLRALVPYALIAFVYSTFWLFAKDVFFPGDDAFSRIYSGQPAFAHVSYALVEERLLNLFEERLDIFIGAIGIITLSVLCRRPQYLVAPIAFIPWMTLNILAIREAAGNISLYYGFPLVFVFIWPVVYEVLRARSLNKSATKNRRIARSAGNSLGSLQPPVLAVLGTIALCATTIRTNEAIDPILQSMRPADTEGRAAVKALMEFIDQGLHRKLGLQVSNSVAAIAPDDVYKNEILGPSIGEASIRGIIFFRNEIGFEHIWDLAVAHGLDSSIELGNVVFASKKSYQNKIASNVSPIVGNWAKIRSGPGPLYAGLRAGPAGRWVNGKLETKNDNPKGLLAFGPYIDLAPGDYSISYSIYLPNCRPSNESVMLKAGVTTNFGQSKILPPHLVDKNMLRENRKCRFIFTRAFKIKNGLSRAVEFPIWNMAGAPVVVENITLAKRDARGEWRPQL